MHIHKINTNFARALSINNENAYANTSEQYNRDSLQLKWLRMTYNYSK